MNEKKELACAAAPVAGARHDGHHWLCNRREFNPLCIGCEAEAANSRRVDALNQVAATGALVTPDMAGSPCDQCGVEGSHLCARSARDPDPLLGEILAIAFDESLEKGDRLQRIVSRIRLKGVIPPPPTCTCPSGDGSLRWPCPVHVEQHGGVNCR